MNTNRNVYNNRNGRDSTRSLPDQIQYEIHCIVGRQRCCIQQHRICTGLERRNGATRIAVVTFFEVQGKTFKVSRQSFADQLPL